MHQVKRWFPFLVLLLSLLFFSACSDSLQKPTGLEEQTSEKTVVQKDETKSENKDSLVEHELTDKVDVIDSNKEDSETVEAKEEEKSSSDSTNKHKSKIDEQKREKNDYHSKKEKQTNKPVKKSDSSKNQSSNSNNKSKTKTNSTSKSSSNGTKKTANKNKENSKHKKDTVTISIVISSNEVPLEPTTQEIEPGDTVLDVFHKVTKRMNIPRRVSGSGSSAYIISIANVREFDRGPGSGWMYRINGVFPDRGVGVVPVQDGDRIEFLYTVNLGEDLNANLQPYRR